MLQFILNSRTIWAWILFFSEIFAACAVGPNVSPVTDSTQRLEFRGFSILPPKGANWFMDSSPTNPGDPRWTVQIVFIKYLKVPATRPAELKSVLASVSTRDLGDVQFESRAQLLKQLAKGFIEDFERARQMKLLSSKASVEKYLGWDCVRYESTYEDFTSHLFPGSVFIFSRHGFALLHPDSPTHVVALEYSQRYLKGEMPPRLEAEVEPFLKSLVLSPLG